MARRKSWSFKSVIQKHFLTHLRIWFGVSKNNLNLFDGLRHVKIVLVTNFLTQPTASIIYPNPSSESNC